MEGRFNNQLNTDNRRARSELPNRVERLAQQILDHIASNPQPAPPAARGHPQPVHRAVRGRAPSRSFPGPTSRSVSFSSVCGCPGVGCTSNPPAHHKLNPTAPSFTPAHPRSRNKARRSRIQGGSSSNLCRPHLTYPDPRASTFQETVVLDTGLASPVLLIPPSHFATPGDSERSTTSPPTRASSLQPTTLASPRASVIRSTASVPAPPLPPRGPSPILEPDTSHIGLEEEVATTKKLELGFRVNIASHFQHEATKISKSYDYSCSCLQRKSLCSCSEAVLEVSLKLRYRLFKEA